MVWRAEPVNHKGKTRMAAYFVPGREADARIRQTEGIQWSNSLKAWHLPDTEENRTKFRIQLPAKAGHNSSKTTEIYTHVSRCAMGRIKSLLMICEKKYKRKTNCRNPSAIGWTPAVNMRK